MRATFISTTLENRANLEDVQKAAGHRDPNTTKVYDRRGYNPEKATRFFATYCVSQGAAPKACEQTPVRSTTEMWACLFTALRACLT
jgi:hypothetical protein